MTWYGWSLTGIIQGICGLIFGFYGLIVMYNGSYESGITTIGVGIAIVSFALADRNQIEILEKLKN